MTVSVNANMLKLIRGQKRWTQEILAEKARVSVATIKRIEGASVARNCQLVQARRLAEALGVDVEDITDNDLPTILGVGSDINLCLDNYTSPEEFRESSEKLLRMIMRRQDLLWKLGRKVPGDPRPDRPEEIDE